MDSKFAKRLEEYLSSECSDYGLSYSWEWNEDGECCDVIITRDENEHKSIRFKYNVKNDDLKIELSEGSYYTTREFDRTVKYFWMLICPVLFKH
jgi:hypothetical protein